MRVYLYTVIVTATAAAFAELLLPSVGHERIAGAVRAVAGLCILVSLLMPLREGIRILGEMADGEYPFGDFLPDEGEDGPPSDYESILDDSLSEVSRKELTAWVVKTMEERFGIPPEKIRVEVLLIPSDEAGGGFRLQEIRIELHGTAALGNPHAIETYFEEQLGCPCHVTVGSAGKGDPHG